MTRGRRSEEKDWWGKGRIYSHFSIAALLRFRPTNEKCLTTQTRFHRWDDPVVAILWCMTVESGVNRCLSTLMNFAVMYMPDMSGLETFGNGGVYLERNREIDVRH
jgi:hypothetical protein